MSIPTSSLAATSSAGSASRAYRARRSARAMTISTPRCVTPKTTFLLTRSSMATLKTCFKCGAQKPRTEFYKHPGMADGLLGKCKPCTRADVRHNRVANGDYYRVYDSMRYHHDPARKANAIQSFAAASKKRPERKQAADLVWRALRRGEIKPQPCWVCGGAAEAHHPDYSRPLDVAWLCVR